MFWNSGLFPYISHCEQMEYSSSPQQSNIMFLWWKCELEGGWVYIVHFPSSRQTNDDEFEKWASLFLQMKKSRPRSIVGSSQCLERIKIRMTHKFQLQSQLDKFTKNELPCGLFDEPTQPSPWLVQWWVVMCAGVRAAGGMPVSAH